MTIRLLSPISVAGVAKSIGDIITGDPAWEADQVNANNAVYTHRDLVQGEGLVPAQFLVKDGNVTWLVGPDGAGVLRGPMVSGLWFTSPSVFRLRMTGTGSVQFDSRNSAGTVTAVATYTLTGATDQIEFPYAGDNAVAIRATFSGDITVEVI